MSNLNELQIQVSLGVITIQWVAQKITSIEWSAHAKATQQPAPVIPASILEVIGKLASYFETGTPLGEISWDKLDQSTWTPFQKQVYETIAEIPHGETRTYGWVAQKIGKFAATRAVGQALRNNPLPILIPCHRVISVTSLGGFMGCSDLELPELRLKSSLISLEEGYLQPQFPFGEMMSAAHGIELASAV